jgi:hypothetical protein
MRTGGTIDGKRDLAEDLREFACCATPQKIHLEKTILGVKKTKGAGDVFATCAADGGNAETIARHRDRRGQTHDGASAVELRQTGAELLIKPGAARAGEQQQNHDGEEKEPSVFG